jgi:hypothetical protein
VTQHVDSIHFDLPENLTRETYVQTLRKVLACVRHELYNRVQEILKRDNKEKVSQDELMAIQEDIYSTKQEEYRRKALALLNIELPSNENPKKLMQKAYLVYSTVSGIKGPGAPAKSRW